MTDETDTDEESDPFDALDPDDPPAPGTWVCPRCGREQGDEWPHADVELNDEVTADVTCQSVYLIVDEGFGVVLDHDEFEELADLYEATDV